MKFAVMATKGHIIGQLQLLDYILLAIIKYLNKMIHFIWILISLISSDLYSQYLYVFGKIAKYKNNKTKRFEQFRIIYLIMNSLDNKTAF